MTRARNISDTIKVKCYHCGDHCHLKGVTRDGKDFCCEGCLTVYELLKDNNMCIYYDMNPNPGESPETDLYPGKYDYLDLPDMKSKLLTFSDGIQSRVTFYAPTIHCSSCIWLLENLQKFNSAITSSEVNFLKKEVTVVFRDEGIRLSQIATLLERTGYTPLISLRDAESPAPVSSRKHELMRIGIAGFCFGNIMMLSFPDYLAGGDFGSDTTLGHFFSYLCLLLSFPVVFYCSLGFFKSAWSAIRYRYLNIDVPIALAIAVTYARSLYEIITQSGTGYLDSMSGIVFFMLIGRYFQRKTYDALSFDRGYSSYFPLGVSLKRAGEVPKSVPVSDLRRGDHMIIHNEEIIPADSILVSPFTHIDYSFVTGESVAVRKVAGDRIYAGGRQLNGACEFEVEIPASASYLVELWNRKSGMGQAKSSSVTDRINRYFSLTVLVIAFGAGLYWISADLTKSIDAFTAVLIVACPCALLLTSTFTDSNLLRIFARNHFYLKNADVIEQLGNTDTVVFDKTGTITHGNQISFTGKQPDAYVIKLIASLASQSFHPLSRRIYCEYGTGTELPVMDFIEMPGLGLKGTVDGHFLIMGSEAFVTGHVSSMKLPGAHVYVTLDGILLGFFSISNSYRNGLTGMLNRLVGKFRLYVLSGDNDSEKSRLEKIFGCGTDLYFNQLPDEKADRVYRLQESGHRVVMVGDGLNDVAALRQSNVGIAVTDDLNGFSPACDAILAGASLEKLPAFIHVARTRRFIISIIFIFSVVYNVAGLWYAVQGNLEPVIAAILMPLSSVTTIGLAILMTMFIARRQGLQT